MRHFIRHPVNIPIEIWGDNWAPPDGSESSNVSRGGLAFRCNRALEPGNIAQLRIPCVKPPFEAKARVAWCLPCEIGYEVGMEFLDADDDLRARMVEQICYIENYRKLVERTERRILTADQAAREWIARYGAHFFDTGGEEGAKH
jgi:hypothetical protein